MMQAQPAGVPIVPAPPPSAMGAIGAGPGVNPALAGALAQLTPPPGAGDNMAMGGVKPSPIAALGGLQGLLSSMHSSGAPGSATGNLAAAGPSAPALSPVAMLAGAGGNPAGAGMAPTVAPAVAGVGSADGSALDRAPTSSGMSPGGSAVLRNFYHGARPSRKRPTSAPPDTDTEY